MSKSGRSKRGRKSSTPNAETKRAKTTDKKTGSPAEPLAVLSLEDIFEGVGPVVDAEEVERPRTTRPAVATRRTFGKKRPTPSSQAQYALLFERSRKTVLSE